MASLFWWVAPANASAQTDTSSNYLIPLTFRDAREELILGILPNQLQRKLNGKVVEIEVFSGKIARAELLFFSMPVEREPCRKRSSVGRSGC